MKNSIRLTALFLLASVSVFAANTSKIKDGDAPSNDVITFSPMAAHRGIDIKVNCTEPGKAIVMIYDQDKNLILKDVLPAGIKAMEKGYVLNKLDNGDYTIVVTANKQVVIKDVHVYDEDRTRVFIVNQ